MLSRRVVIFAAVLALLAVVAVQAKQPHHKQPARRPHPEETADAATLANWARIRAELEARNYTRPSSKDVHHITRHRQFAAGEPLSGAYGVDVSSWVGQSTWTCLKNNGYSFAVVREFMETCQVDGNGVHTVANAWAAGLAHVDIYLFPSYGCGTSPAGQVDAAINSMGSIPFGQIWFDIETGGQSSYANNYNWLKAATDQAVAKLGHARVGIYSSRYEWSSVMGSYSGFQDFPLWWATYDGQPGFGGFSGFAGWTSPAIHQFAGSQGVCGANVDLNWY